MTPKKTTKKPAAKQGKKKSKATATTPPTPKQPSKKTAPTKPRVSRERRLPNYRLDRFCEFIAAGEPPADAWILAGYKVSRDVARRNAHEALTKPDTQAKIAALRKPVTRKVLMTRDRKRELLGEIAENLKEKAVDRIRAMEVDARLAGHNEPDRTEIDVGDKTLHSIKERAAEVISALAGRYDA